MDRFIFQYQVDFICVFLSASLALAYAVKLVNSPSVLQFDPDWNTFDEYMHYSGIFIFLLIASYVGKDIGNEFKMSETRRKEKLNESPPEYE